jgi:hypothetical protein
MSQLKGTSVLQGREDVRRSHFELSSKALPLLPHFARFCWVFGVRTAFRANCRANFGSIKRDTRHRASLPKDTRAVSLQRHLRLSCRDSSVNR